MIGLHQETEDGSCHSHPGLEIGYATGAKADPEA
jgi:hypothetical protein